VFATGQTGREKMLATREGLKTTNSMPERGIIFSQLSDDGIEEKNLVERTGGGERRVRPTVGV